MTKRHRREKGGGYGQRHPAEICRQREDMPPPCPMGSPAQTLPCDTATPVAGGASAFLIGEEETGGVSPYEQSGSTHYHPDKPPEGYPGGAGEAAAPDRRTGGAPTRGWRMLFRQRHRRSGAAVRLPGGAASPCRTQPPVWWPPWPPPAQEDRVLDVRRSRRQVLCHGHGPPGSGPDLSPAMSTPHKLKLIDSGAQRLGITSIRTALADARRSTPHGWSRRMW